MLYIFLTLYRAGNFVVPFKIDQAFQPVLPCKTVNDTFAVFPYATCEITRHTNI